VDSNSDDAAETLLAQVATAYRESAASLRRVAYATLYDAGLASEADDIVTNAIAEILEKQPKGVENWEAYLVTVVRRRAIDFLRSAEVRRRDHSDYDVDVTPSERFDIGEVEEKIDVLAEMVRAVNALNELDDRLRGVAYSFFWEQKKQTEIAGELGITQARVSQLVGEARKHLQVQIRGGVK
jgi:RNA polymerase sigma factor (sigma-70 family)